MVEEVMDLDYSNSLFIEMNRPRQSRRIAGACYMYEWLFGKILQDSIYVEIDDGLGPFF